MKVTLCIGGVLVAVLASCQSRRAEPVAVYHGVETVAYPRAAIAAYPEPAVMPVHPGLAAPAHTGPVTVKIPPGDPVAGKLAFAELRCHACHRVEGHDFPEPVASPEVPIVLGPRQSRQSRMQLVESITAPSCAFPADIANVRSGTLSRMGDYNTAMTVRQLVDLVAFLQSLETAPDRPPVD